jgi:hypothetical protein
MMSSAALAMATTSSRSVMITIANRAHLLRVLWHALTPVLLQLLLILTELVASLLALFLGVGILEGCLVVVDVGHIVAEFVAVRPIAMAAPAAALMSATMTAWAVMSASLG